MPEQNLTAWLKWCHEKNREAFVRRLSASDAVDWSRKGIQIGVLCLNPLFESVVCFVAGDDGLADQFLTLASSRISHASAAFGSQVELDRKGLDRVQVVLAARWLSAVRGSGSRDLVSVPFDAFPRHLANLTDVELNNAVRIYWALFGLLEERYSEYQEALRSGVKVHRDLKEEMAMLDDLPALMASPNATGWERFGSLMRKWLDPRNDTESYATNYQLDFSFLFALFLAKFRLQGSGRDIILSVYSRS